MTNCTNCGKSYEERTMYCPHCGAPAGGAANPSMDVQNNKVMGILAYIGILVLVPIFAAKESPFARYHANQGLVLWIAGIICSAVTPIPILGWIVGGLGGIAVLVLMIMGIINAASGEMKPLPFIGGISILK